MRTYLTQLILAPIILAGLALYAVVCAVCYLMGYDDEHRSN